MRLHDLIAGLEITPGSGADLDARVCDITEDSRTVMPGSLFVARRGLKTDGRAFAASALRAGAVAVLTDDVSLNLPMGDAKGTPSAAAGGANAAPLLVTRDVGFAAGTARRAVPSRAH